jgi:trehalose 6-phosphate synthase/phosphatase
MTLSQACGATVNFSFSGLALRATLWLSCEESLQEAADNRVDRQTEKPVQLPVADVLNDFRQSRQRLLLFDHDGTLVAYAPRPQDAVPSPELLRRLGQLAANPANVIAVISGRSRFDLEAWFGTVKGLWLAAEHGAIMRSPSSAEWELYRANYIADWKAQVSPLLEHFVNRTPGSFIEEKEFSIVWHYRMPDPEFGEWLANELGANLEQMLAETELRVYRSQKSVEVKPVWANKGEVLARLVKASTEPSFCLAAGDDRTDEDLFARLPETAWAVHIGDNPTRARFCLSNPQELRQLIEQLAAADAFPKASTASL